MEAGVFILGGFAAMAATVFTNPLEVVKTRMQLQGELAAKGKYVEPYRNVFHAFVTVAKHDGMAGLQKGLSSALVFQFIINSVRLDIYNRAVVLKLTENKDGSQSLLKGGLWGGIGGILGAVLASPFFMVKTHLQSQAVAEIAVGYQHKHTGMLKALKDIFQQNGIKGLYRGVQVAVPRGFLGSGGQLAAFGFTKDYLRRHDIAVGKPMIQTLIAGATAGTVMSLTITPPDVVATRLYNQGVDARGKGIYYKGIFDCVWKILKIEGPLALYKGFWAQYLRIGPHAALVLFFFDEFKRMIMIKTDNV